MSANVIVLLSLFKLPEGLRQQKKYNKGYVGKQD